MKERLQGFIGGLILMICFSFGIGFAVNDEAELNSKTLTTSIKEHVKSTFHKMINSSCILLVPRGRYTVRSECRANEVMTGFDGSYIYCSTPQVNCSPFKDTEVDSNY